MDDFLITLAILVGAALLIAPIGVLILARKLRLLTRRVAELELRASAGAASGEASPIGPWVRPEDRKAPEETGEDEAVGAEDIATAASGTQDMPDVSVAASAQASVPRAVVFRADVFARTIAWVRENWFLGVAALSLALAGVFMVQYGVEQGLLTPFARIMGALGLGTALIVGGEVVRRRYGDESGSLHALPSTFSGAGLVTLFSAVLAARHLYGMLPSDLALFALIAVAALAVVLGWFYGPFLAAIGIVGALGAPFVVGGSSDAPHLFYYYFALIVSMALAIDTVRRWAWVSVLAVIGGFAAMWVLLLGGAEAVHALGFAMIVVLAATAIPVRRVWPDHGGAMLTSMMLKLRRKSGGEWPEFPTRLAGGVFLAAVAVAFVMPLTESGMLEGWIGIWSLWTLGLLALVWMVRAPALEDLSLVAPVALIVLVTTMALELTQIYDHFAYPLPPAEGVEPAFNYAASLFTAMMAIYAALGYWRAARGVTASLFWVLASALCLPAMMGVLEMLWGPSRAIGAYIWAGHAIGGAVLMTVLAERSAKRWRADKRPAALFAMSALSLISFALMLILSTAALNVAIAVMIVIAALLDRRLDMKPLGYFIQLAVAVLAWRFIVDPGLDWAASGKTALWEVLLAYAVPLALVGTAWWLLKPRARIGAQLALESAVWSLGAVFVLILLERMLGRNFESFWGISLTGATLLISMGTQLYRWRRGLPLGWLRVGLAGLFGVVGVAALFLGQVVLSPLERWGAKDIKGPLVFDTIAVAYLVPAAVLAVLVWKLGHLHRVLRMGFAALSAAMVAAYVGFEIRRFWQGADIHTSQVSQGELYSYTIAMMIAAVALLVLAFARRSVLLRKLAMAGIAVTIAKVFLIDMSGLTGLIRVASFLGLGLALSGLAWLNRAMTARWGVPAAGPVGEQAAKHHDKEASPPLDEDA